jgi:hypothetical protein
MGYTKRPPKNEMLIPELAENSATKTKTKKNEETIPTKKSPGAFAPIVHGGGPARA